ncbi:MAG: DUF2079 domain-containing protein [Polyangiaceae bacterium]|nr:DUF2079 domain-containing protein [Polyangiaceae bacterium]
MSLPPPSPIDSAPAERRRAFSEGLARAARILALCFLIGAALATWVFFTFGGGWVSPFLAGNELDMPRRMSLIRWTLGAGAGGMLVGVALMTVARAKRWPQPHLERGLWIASPLLIVAFLPQVFRAKPWVNRHDILLPLVLCLALATEVLVTRSLSELPEAFLERLRRLRDRLPGWWQKWGPLAVVVLAAVGYAAFMSFYNLRWHYKLRTHNFDLAIDNNLIFRAMHGAHMESTVTHGNAPGQYLAAHAKLGQYVILPIYALFPRPETLMVLQGVFLGAGALPLFGFARRHVSDWAAVAIALAYLAYYPLHCSNFVESKYLSYSIFFVLATFWAAERKKWVVFAFAFFAAMLMREDVPIGLAVGGVFMLLTGHRPIAGVIMAVVSLGWFLALRALMNRAGSWWFPGMYKGLWAPGEEGYGSVLKTVLSNPLYVLNEILRKDKLQYLLHLFVPLVLLPTRRWYLWAAFIPGTALTLFVTDYKPIFGFSFQYTAHWIPYLFLVVPLAIAAIAKNPGEGPWRARGVIVAMGVASAALSYNFGAFGRRTDSVRGGYFHIEFTYTAEERQRYAELRSVIAELPKTASVVASENVGPHVSSRTHMYAMRRGLYDAEYILVAKNEIDFEATRKLLTEAVTTNAYGVVKRAGDFALLKKGADPAGNAALAADFKL